MPLIIVADVFSGGNVRSRTINHVPWPVTQRMRAQTCGPSATIAFMVSIACRSPCPPTQSVFSTLAQRPSRLRGELFIGEVGGGSKGITTRRFSRPDDPNWLITVTRVLEQRVGLRKHHVSPGLAKTSTRAYIIRDPSQGQFTALEPCRSPTPVKKVEVAAIEFEFVYINGSACDVSFLLM